MYGGIPLAIHLCRAVSFHKHQVQYLCCTYDYMYVYSHATWEIMSLHLT